MNVGMKWALVMSYVLALLVPVVALASLGCREIETWWATGMCPAGPMDRAAAPCGVFDLVGIVFFGGWAAFIVVPVLVIWVVGCSACWAACARWLRRRAMPLGDVLSAS